MKHFIIFLCFAFVLSSISVNAEESERFVLASPQHQATIFVAETEPECVQIAVQNLIADVKKITAIELKKINTVPKEGSVLMIGTVGVAESDGVFGKLKFTLPETFSSKWECFRIEKINSNQLVICGSDERGTMFGIYDFLEKQLGVDPFYFWKDREPKKCSEISFDKLSVTSEAPTFQYRGWFINDEDLLTEWKEGGGQRNINYPYYSQVVHPEVMNRVVEALVRNKFNLIIPASFLDIMNPAEEELVKTAARRGVFLSQHHIEPLGVSGFSYFNYWKAKDGSSPLFSFYSNRDKLVEVWNHYAERWAKYPNVIWQLGLRGTGDRPMWTTDSNVPQSDAERGQIISDAISVQREIVRKFDLRDKPPITVTLWAEGSQLFHRGFLKLPDEAIIVFSDNSPGWKFQNDFYSIKREKEKRYGVYYHHQLWGSGPHLAQGISPRWTWTVFKETLDFPATDYAILNVSNIREFVLGLEASGQFLYDFKNFDPKKFMETWTTTNFPSKPKEIENLYNAYFSAFILRQGIKTPLLLDGLTRSRGLKVLETIQLYVTDNAKFRKSPPSISKDIIEIRIPHPTDALRPTFVNEPQQDVGNVTISMGLSDAYPSVGTTDTALLMAQSQRKAFEQVAAQAETILPTLTNEEQKFLKINLTAQNDIMIALSGWYENLILARIILAYGHEEAAVEYLRRAIQSLERIENARQVLTENEKWKFWYRGDKKMNLPALKTKTTEILKDFSKNKLTAF
ncbi:MAG: glycosyl hydrolase 115 family protein [Planctomycetaceae bacterium]|nr:glycosyl hydrolase 115 family protein [Planctomycetaceae bacterium]